MRGISLALSLLILVTPASVTRLSAQGCSEPGRPLALVLSGGGAKGMAHVGVLQVLDSLGIRPDLVVGASMGAVVGSLYASGFTADQILARTAQLDLHRQFNATDPKTPRAISEHRPILVWEEGASGPRASDAYARESATNMALSATLLHGNLAAKGSFDSLPIPFRAIATDLRTREEVVLSGGDLALAVRASMGVPIVFDPVRVAGRDLIDGGIAANLPVRAAREAGAVRVLVSDVGSELPDSILATDPLAVANLMISYLFTQPPDSLGPEDRLIRPAVDTFATLDFSANRLDEIVRRGRQAARASFEARPSCETPRPAPVPRLPPLRAAPQAGNPQGETRALQQFLGLNPGEDLDVDRIQTALAGVARADEYLAIWLNPTGRADSLAFNLEPRRTPTRLLLVSAAYDNDLGGQLWVGAADRGRLLRGLELSSLGVLGELRKEVSAGVRVGTYGHRAVRPFVTGQAIWEEVRQFTPSGADLPAIGYREQWGTAGLELRLGAEWLLSLGGGVGGWDSDSTSADHSAGVVGRLASGPSYWPSRFTAEGDLNSVFSRVRGEVRRRFHLASVGVTPELAFGWGDSLPVGRTFQLGGSEGFPGFHIGELRGDRMASAQLTIDRSLLGPVAGRLRAATGQVANGGPALPHGEWEFGFAAGLTAASPVGPLVLEYGFAIDGPDRVMVRVGEWF